MHIHMYVYIAVYYISGAHETSRKGNGNIARAMKVGEALAMVESEQRRVHMSATVVE